MAMVEAKAAGNEIAVPEAPQRPAPVLDLMAALEGSLARAEEAGRGHAGEPEGRDRERAERVTGAAAGRRIAKAGQQGTVEVGGRQVGLSNLDKVLWPVTGTTKGDMVGYYARIAPVIVPHLAGRAVTLKRYPDGVEKGSFFEKNCPSHKPPWVGTVRMGEVDYCLVEEPAAVVWMANLAAIELHPTLGAKPDLGSPTSVVFDLDPGAPADVLSCARVAVLVRELLEPLRLESWVKTSGSKGLQLYAPLNAAASYERPPRSPKRSRSSSKGATLTWSCPTNCARRAPAKCSSTGHRTRLPRQPSRCTPFGHAPSPPFPRRSLGTRLTTHSAAATRGTCRSAGRTPRARRAPR